MVAYLFFDAKQQGSVSRWRNYEIHLPWIPCEKNWETMSESELNALVDECFAYEDLLRKNGHFVGSEALQSPRNATTLRWKNGKVFITDGPYAETKEQLGGILVLEARDLNHAVQLMSKHPGVKAGPWETARLRT